MRWLLPAFFALLLVAAPPALAATPCEPCNLPDGTYHVVVPPDWDGRSRLRLFLYLHGWRQHGTDATGDANIAGVASRLGYLLVAPDGAEGPHGTGWGHVGSPETVRDDLAFLIAVLKDAEHRWPIDLDSVVAGGFSQGASMVWDLACYRARYFTAFIPFSGGFWAPMPDACTSGPVALRHTHGLHDHMVPLAGRAILDGKYRQADIFAGLTRWRAADRCAAEPDQVSTEDTLTCMHWTQCDAVGEVELCLHDGDHAMIAPWLEASLRWAMTARSVPAVAP
jgi:polyhydroxybutyrate depolymerase